MKKRNLDKYKIWVVHPRAEWNTGRQNTALLLVILGTKQQAIARWHELTDRGEFHMPLLFWQRIKTHCKSYKQVRYAMYKSFDWKPDALLCMRELRLQFKNLIVEDLT